MNNSVYQINKGINKSIEFRGLKAQYIWYFGAGVIGLLILFAILYILGVNSFICIGIILIAGTGLTIKIYALSNTYGQYGMMKKLARRGIPKVIRSKNRAIFFKKK
ncbi:MAG: DUF4133 domain-containing protein [Ginsengibacter sp.]